MVMPKRELVFYTSCLADLYSDIVECSYVVRASHRRAELRLIMERVRSEGVGFLTKTLPSLGKAVLTALSDDSQLAVPSSYSKRAGSAIPQFLGWLLEQVFDKDGFELDNSNPMALRHFLQLVYLYYKLELPYETEIVENVLDQFVEVDDELRQYDAALTEDNQWLRTARNLFTGVFGTLDLLDIRPGHGPGAVSTGECVFRKSVFTRLYTQLERIYPFTGYFRYNLTHVVDTLADIQNLKVQESGIAKVILVPKDSRGPRLISSEPVENQWIQQGQGAKVVSLIEKHPLTKGRVNFTHQDVNRALALEGSRVRHWVTLDMKEASDRVSNPLVQYLLRDCPDVLSAIQASRSTHTLLRPGQVMPLHKFAPMGSRVCFPIEAMVFWALSVSAIIHQGVSRRLALRCVYVYGDDIITTRENYACLLQRLPTVGLKFNSSKCCTGKSFRESCGMDAFKGVQVTPIRLKTRMTWSRNPETLQAYVSFHNEMYKQGFFRICQTVRSEITEIFGRLPETTDWVNHWIPRKRNPYHALSDAEEARAMKAPAWLTYQLTNNNALIRKRISPYQTLEYLTWVSRPKVEKTPFDGWDELLRRHFLARDRKHGGLYALVRRNRLKRTWASV